MPGAGKHKYFHDAFNRYREERRRTSSKVLSNALIRKGIGNISSIGEDEQDALKRLMEVSLNRLPEKIHGTKFLKVKSYENETACRDFIQNAAECLFQENLEKLK